MTALLLTQYDGAILGPIAKVLGVIMNVIYNALAAVGIPNIGLAIILFTIVINVLLLPLTIRQQKFNKLSSKMNPEINAIRKKYEGKRDNASVTKMQEEMDLVYEKYGTSSTNGCLPLLIQMPVLFALWRVINNVPAYVGAVKDMFMGLVDAVMNVPGFQEAMEVFVADHRIVTKLNFETVETTKNTLIDVFYVFKASDWTSFLATKEFSGLGAQVAALRANIAPINNFLGLSMTERPLDVMKAVLTGGSIGLAILALMIPILSGVSQWLSTKVMMAATGTGNDKNADDMASNMANQMNTTMPIVSAIFCLTFQVGLGIYWIASAVARLIIQLILNKAYEKVDVNDLIAENQKKMAKKKEKRGYKENQISERAAINTRKVKNNRGLEISQEKEEALQKAYAKEVKAGSLASRARMVEKYNETHQKGKR